jgi:cytochrome c biogenesis protein CcmG, thiol:disulfide interchange protein DsbE
MNAQNRHTAHGNRRFLWLALIGFGLILFAVISATVLPKHVPAQQGTTGGRIITPAQLSMNAPDLNLRDLDGNPVSLLDYRDKVVLINNWATWCPPCRAEMPELEAYYQQQAGNDFKIVAIDAGEPEEIVRSFVQEYDLSFEIWLDPNSHTLSAFRNNALPSTYVVDREGIIRLAWSGAVNLKTLEKFVTPLLEN